MKATKVYGLMILQPSQKPGIDAHCFGDCGKISMAGGIDCEVAGPLMVCCEHECPWLDKQMDEPWGTTMSFGRPHKVYLRTVKQPAREPVCGEPSSRSARSDDKEPPAQSIEGGAKP